MTDLFTRRREKRGIGMNAPSITKASNPVPIVTEQEVAAATVAIVCGRLEVTCSLWTPPWTSLSATKNSLRTLRTVKRTPRAASPLLAHTLMSFTNDNGMFLPLLETSFSFLIPPSCSIRLANSFPFDAVAHPHLLSEWNRLMTTLQ